MYHSFRYVAVTGLRSQSDQKTLTAHILRSSAATTATFRSSSALLDRLMDNSMRSLEGDLMGLPTDCPQRDERCGWMGDILAFCRTATFHMNCAAFLTKWLEDVFDAQVADGRLSDISPNPFKDDGHFLGAPGWGDAEVLIPWIAYLQYGDSRILERAYRPATRWVEWVLSNNPNRLWLSERGNDYGDWLNADDLDLGRISRPAAAVPKVLFATAFWAHSVDVLAKIAEVLGFHEDARRYRDLFSSIAGAFCQEFLNSEDRAGDTQGAFALALGFNLVPEEFRGPLADRLLEKLEAQDQQISTGLPLTPLVLAELGRAGHVKAALDALLDEREG